MSATLEDSAQGYVKCVGRREPTEEDKQYNKELDRTYLKDTIWQATPFYWVQRKIRSHLEKKYNTNPFDQ